MMSAGRDGRRAGPSAAASIISARRTAGALSVPRALSSKAGGLHRWLVPRSAANLGAWLNEPVVMNPVIACLKSADGPITMRDVAIECLFPPSSINRVLLRLHGAGRVIRYKLPMQRPGYSHKTKASTPGTARRWLFVYSWVA